MLDSTWAHRLGVRRSSEGIYRIAHWKLMKYLEQLQLGQPALDDIIVGESHPHFVEFYDTEAFLIHCVQDFLGAGVVAGDVVIRIATDAHRNAFDHALREAGIDIHGAQRGGRFVTQATSGALARFMVDDIPDPGRFRATIGQLVSQAVQRGREVRIYSEMVAMLWDEGNVPAALILEDLWNDLAVEYPSSLFCACPAHAFIAKESAGGYQAICGQHSQVILHCVPNICGRLCVPAPPRVRLVCLP